MELKGDSLLECTLSTNLGRRSRTYRTTRII